MKLSTIFSKISSLLLVGLILVCLLTRWTPPPESVQALNKVANWDFNGNANGWTATNGTANAAATGAPACGTTADVTGTNMTTFAYNVGTFRAITAATKNVNNRGNINQTVVAPGSGEVKAKGKFSYSASASAWGGGKISLEIWNSNNTSYVASLGCVTMNANVSLTTTSFGSDVSLTGGTTYTIRVNMVAQTRSNTAAAITLTVDDIVVNFAPVGLATSTSASSTGVQLNWTASTAGTGANGLHATNPYKVYRDASSPVSTFLATSTTNSYTDSSTSGNTTYYYAISDVDTVSQESPLSAEASILTLPGAPTSLNFTNIGTSSMRINWSAPTGGAASYKVDRCQGPGCSNFSEIASGQTNVYYDDSGLVENMTYNYRVRATNATGNGVYSSSAEQATLNVPDPPTNLNFTNVASTTLTLNWTASLDGADSYKVERCQGASCSSFSQIAAGVTNVYYNDFDLSGNTTYNYRVRGTNANGDGEYSVPAATTTPFSAIISVSIDNGTVNYGNLGLGLSSSTLASFKDGKLSQTQLVINNGNVAEVFNIKGQDSPCPWTLAGSAGVEQYRHQFSTSGGSIWYNLTTNYQTLSGSIAVSSSLPLDLQVTVPLSTSCGTSQNVDVVIQAIEAP